jgi:ABC-2 type transport system ATP-binding protein
VQVIEVSHLHKRYGSVHAVRGVSFEVEKGTVVGVLGPNGAGKSTTLRILAGFLGATRGTVRIAGHDILDERLEAIRNIGYMPETSPLYPEMRVNEYLRFRAELKGVPRRKRSQEVERVLDAAWVRDMARRLVGQLSKGYRQRVGLADALLGSPPLLILDEPTAGLDPNQIQQVRNLIRGLRKKHTVLLSTHILSEVEATCERAIVIHQGEVVAKGTIAELRNQRSNEVQLVVSTRMSDEADARATSHVLEVIEKVEGVVTARKLDPHALDDDTVVRLLIIVDPDLDGARVREEISLALGAERIALRHLAPVSASLEEVFARLTQGHSR